ncbi:MAG: hypothetical protein ACP5XB_31000, partial [Isosphaeraceae bacterium]
MLEVLESRELLSTTLNVIGSPNTPYTLQQFGGPPAAALVQNGIVQLAAPTASGQGGQDNSISFNTSDPGGFYQVNATWVFTVTPVTGLGTGLSFALLNTSVYGTTGGAASSNVAQGLYSGSVAFGFDTTNNVVNLSLNGQVVDSVDLTTLTTPVTLDSGKPIEADAVFDFPSIGSQSGSGTVSLTLTPFNATTPVPVFT